MTIKQFLVQTSWTSMPKPNLLAQWPGLWENYSSNKTLLILQLVSYVIYQQSSMCEWEQECSDNPLLFNPIFARQYIKERQSWLINKQPICEKCKLHIAEHYSQNVATLFKEQKINVDSKPETPETNTLLKEQIINVHSTTETLKNKATPNSIHQQCHDFSNSDKITIA